MKTRDRELGMDRPISRRDLLHGMGLLAASALCNRTGPTFAREQAGAAVYPPALMGLRGSHVGSFEVAHDLARQGRRDWGTVQSADHGTYDLVVVGGGLSGLAAAHFFLQRRPGARVLILDNHDDFGGNARRNEFQVGGRTLIGYGGNQSLEAPSGYSETVKGLLRDLGVDTKRLEPAYDQEFFRRHGLTAGIYFNPEEWGVDRLVRFDLGNFSYFLPLALSPLSAREAVAQMPISRPAQRELRRLLLTHEDQIPHVPPHAKEEYLYRLSYRDFLSKHLNITEPEVFAVLQDLTTDSGAGIEATPAYDALEYTGLPGWDAAGLPDTEEYEPYIHHFPDGNASIARLLVRRLIPAVAPGSTMEDVVTARFDYSQLDRAESSVRLRLESTVVHVEHDGDAKSAEQVLVAYVKNGRAHRVQARSCVLACDNAMIPYLCPQLPASQREALAQQVRTPVLYTTVALSNWRAWKKLGLGGAVAPGSYHIAAMLDFPVSLGGYSFATGPDDPITVHMERFPHRSNEGLTLREQSRIGRREMLATSFETIERSIRGQLAGMLGGGGFDPALDIEGITVNRWPHGYSYTWYNPLFDPVYENDDDERYPHIRARRRLGRIAIANADAGANAMFETAVEQAHRAVSELT